MKFKISIVMFLMMVSFLPAGFSVWYIPVQLNTGDNLKAMNPAIDIDLNGNPHVVWAENISEYWVSLYSMANDNMEWSNPLTISTDDSINRESKFYQFPHIAINPNTNRPSAAFVQRNFAFYLGTEQATIYFIPDVMADWEGNHQKGNLNHFFHQSVSGMAEHAKSPFLLFNNASTINGGQMDDFMIFWDQHENMSDYDHEVYYNYRMSDVYPGGELRGWQSVQMAGKNGSYYEGKSDFEPFATVNDYVDSPQYGNIYIVTYDFDRAPEDNMTVRIYDNQANPPIWRIANPWTTQKTNNRASIAHFYIAPDEYHENGEDHICVTYTHFDESQTEWTLYFTESTDMGISWTNPIAIAPSLSENDSRPLIDIDHFIDENEIQRNLIYIAYVANDEMPAMAVLDYDYGENPTWMIRRIPANPYTHRHVYLKVAPDASHQVHVVYDEQVNDDWYIFWTKYIPGGSDNGVTPDWIHF